MASVKHQKRTISGKNDKQAAAAVPSPGSRLRQAREALGMEISTLAEQLHLSKAMVQALEEENYELLPARVFVRGYYRNFARLVNVPEEVVLAEFERRCPEGEDCTVPPVVAQGVRKEIRSSHGLVRLVTWLVVIALLTTFGLWWKSYLGKGSLQTEGTEEVVDATPQEADEVDARAATASEPGEPPALAAVETTPPAPAPVTTMSAAEEPRDQPADTAQETASPPPATAAPPHVILSFKGDCWVDVRGANKSFKVVGKRKAGDTIELTGEPPYRMVLGNARNVTILVNDKPYDLTPHTKGNVAKLTLDPTAAE